MAFKDRLLNTGGLYDRFDCKISCLEINRGLDGLGRFSAIFQKDYVYNFCEFLFAFLLIKPLLKRDLLKKVRLCSKILTF